MELRCREDLQEGAPPQLRDPPGYSSEPGARQPALVPMGAQASRHLRWLAPRLTSVRELALLDWVRPATVTCSYSLWNASRRTEYPLF